MRGRAKRTPEAQQASQKGSESTRPERLRSRDIGEANQQSRKSKPDAAKRTTSVGPKLRSTASLDRRTLTVHVPLKMHKRGGRRLVVGPDGIVCLPTPAKIDSTLVKAIARAFRWQKLIENGTYASIAEIARAEKINDSYVSRLLRLTLLALEIVEAILDGRQTPGLRIEVLLKPMSVEWERQQESASRL